MIAALETLGSEVAFLVTGSNADPEGETIGRVMRRFAENRENARFVASLGSNYYFNALRHMDAMVGNSSSGLLEAQRRAPCSQHRNSPGREAHGGVGH